MQIVRVQIVSSRVLLSLVSYDPRLTPPNFPTNLPETRRGVSGGRPLASSELVQVMLN